jgi:hypothetical protein
MPGLRAVERVKDEEPQTGGVKICRYAADKPTGQRKMLKHGFLRV